MDTLTPDERIVCADHLFIALLEKGTDGIFMVQEDGAITYANAQIAALLGFSVEELLAMHYSYLLSDDRALAGADRFKAFFDEKKGFDRYETTIKTRGGLAIPVEVLALEVTFKGVPAQCLVVRDVSDHKKMEAEIMENADRYKDIFDNANDLIFNTSPDGHLIYVNRAWEDALGYTKEDMLSRTLFDMIHPDGQAQGAELLRRIFSGESIPSVNIILMSKSGGKIFLEGDINTHFVDGMLVSVRGIFRNITKKLINERRIRELASIVDRSFEAIVITDLLGIIQYVNASWEQLNGWTAEEVVGRLTPRVIKSGMQDAAFYEQFWKTLLSGEIVEKTITNKRKNGDLYQAEIIVMPLRDEAGAITGFAGFQHDVTARNSAQQALMDAKTYAESIVEGANAIVVVLDTHGSIEVFNKRAEEITGYTRADLVGKNWFEVLVPKDRYPEVWKMFEESLKHGFPKTFENPILTKDGRELIIAWTNSDRIKDGKISGVIVFGMDITDRKKIEQMMIEKSRDLERFKDLMVGRELKMIELKNELDAIKKASTAHAEKTIN